MKKALIGVFILFIVCTPLLAAEKEVKVPFVTSGLGSNVYSVGLTLEALTAELHPWLRISTAEGPGCDGCFYGALTDPQKWANRIFCVGTNSPKLASRGLQPYDKQYPDPMKHVKILTNYNSMFGFLVTLNPKIKTEKDLDGKTVALGRIAQGAWGLMPTIVLKNFAPDVKVKLDYLDPNSAMQAMIDGRADAAVAWILLSPDFKTQNLTPSLVELVASKRKFYWVGYSEQLRAKAEQMGWTDVLDAHEIPPGVLPGNMPDKMYITWQGGTLAAMETFPENIAYEFVKFLIANHAELVKRNDQTRSIFESAANMVAFLTPEDLHPGALKAYREAGLIK